MDNINASAALRASYDQNVDVLYITRGAPCDVEGAGLPDGLELDFDSTDGTPCGLTVLGYYRNGWANKRIELAALVADHLSLEAEAITSIIAAAVPH